MVIGKDMKNLQVYGIVDLNPIYGKFNHFATLMLGTVNWSETLRSVKSSLESKIAARLNISETQVLIDVSVKDPEIRTQFLMPYWDLEDYVYDVMDSEFIRQVLSVYPVWGKVNRA